MKKEAPWKGLRWQRREKDCCWILVGLVVINLIVIGFYVVGSIG